MASSDAMRKSYPETVIGQTPQGHPRCDFTIGARVAFPSTLTSSGELLLLVHPLQEEAWRAFAAVMRQVGYQIREKASGTANCRNIDQVPFGKTSLHAHLSAVDLNPSKNKKRNTDQPQELQEGLAAIRTRKGDQVFKNLTHDRMHWQINCTPASLASGIDPATVQGVFGSNRAVVPSAVNREVEEQAMDKQTWERVQAALQSLDPPLYEGKTIDGVPGKDTNTAVRAFEKRMNLAQRGVIGALKDPSSGMWPASRELLFIIALTGKN